MSIRDHTGPLALTRYVEPDPPEPAEPPRKAPDPVPPAPGTRVTARRQSTGSTVEGELIEPTLVATDDGGAAHVVAGSVEAVGDDGLGEALPEIDAGNYAPGATMLPRCRSVALPYIARHEDGIDHPVESTLTRRLTADAAEQLRKRIIEQGPALPAEHRIEIKRSPRVEIDYANPMGLPSMRSQRDQAVETMLRANGGGEPVEDLRLPHVDASDIPTLGAMRVHLDGVYIESATWADERAGRVCLPLLRDGKVYAIDGTDTIAEEVRTGDVRIEGPTDEQRRAWLSGHGA